MMHVDLLLSDHTYILERLKREALIRVLSRLHGITLDLGCGQGQYRRLVSAVGRYVGIDRVPSPSTALLGDVASLPIRDAVADCVLLTEVLEHVREPINVLREVRRVLRPGGTAYVTVPMSWALHGAPNDYYRFTPYGIAYLAARSGLRVSDTQRIGGLAALVAARCVDAIGSGVIRAALVRLGSRRGTFRVPAILLSPLNLLGYYLSRVIDRRSRVDAIGWAFVLERPTGP